jgi:hypothetical protein
MFSTETVIHLVRPECPQQLFIPIQVQISNEKNKSNVKQTYTLYFNSSAENQYCLNLISFFVID